MNNTIKISSLLLLGAAATSCCSDCSAPKKPNVIYILADDMGPGDLGCYGQKIIETPNIDRLAKSGMRFTQHYTGCTVSAPSRSALLSGLHTGHTTIRGNREMRPHEGQYPLAGEIYTLAEMFKDAGYTTGAFGKWGLGYVGSEGDANAQGFDEFFGYNCQRMAHRYYPEYLWLNQEKYPLEGNDTKNMAIYAPKVIQERALDFIRKNKDQPFFAYVPIVQPHAELLAEDDEILQYYKNKIKDDVPYLSTKPGAEYGSEDFDYMQYCSQTHTRATFAAMIATVDRYVGEIMDEVERLGLTENTVILFASDNGPHQEGGADPDYFNSNWDYRGYKRSLTDGGIRTPFIVSWKGQIAAGSGSEHVSAFWDMLPTMAELAGVELTAPTDGISMVAELTGKGEQHKHEFLYWEYSLSGGLQILRMDQWKVHRTKVNNGPNGPVLLYNILEDKEELNDVAAQHPDVVKRALEIMDREHVPSDVFPFTYEKKK